jgi:hypothetical protein
MKTLLRSVLLASVLLLMLPGLALADGPDGGKLVFGGTYTLTEGQTLNGDLVVIGGTVTVEKGAQVNGNVALVGGTVTIDGQVSRDAVAVGGTLSLGPSSMVSGNVATFGAMINRAEGSQVGGQITSGGGLQVPFTLSVPQTIPQTGTWPFGAQSWNAPFSWRFDATPLANGASLFMRSLGLAALAVLVVIFWPTQTQRIAQASLHNAPISGALGLLTAIVAPGLLILLAITLCLIPIAALGAMLLLAAVVFGWIAIGAEVGQRMAEVFKWTMHPAASAALGTFVLTLVLGVIGIIPCIGWLGSAIVGAIGLGAVVLTRFGMRSYGEQTLAAPPASPVSA